MTEKEISDLMEEIHDELYDIIEEASVKFNKFIDKKLKSMEHKIKSNSEYSLIRRNITDVIWANIGYNIYFGYANYQDENNIILFNEI